MARQTRGRTLRRTMRSRGGRLLRRLGMLPGGMPDGLGQDEELLGTSLTQTVMVCFPDTPDALYQLEQWYGPLRALNERHPVIIVLQDSRTATLVRQGSGLPCIVVARYATMDDLLSRSDVKLALYVNYTPEVFSNLRFGSMIHVCLLHGDSDKVISVSNQVKAFDFSFVAGQAAIDRMAAHIMLFDASLRCIAVGLPQLDGAGATPAPPPPERSVLYAPTWEGAQPTAGYSSLATMGVPLVRSLLDGGLRVIYRPHPLTGVRDSRYGQADAEVRALLEHAREADPAAGHRIDVSVPTAESFAAAQILICDISGIAQEWLPTTRPILIADPGNPEAVVARTRLLDVTPMLTPADAENSADLVRHHLESDPTHAARQELIEYYLTDIRPGAATGRFVQACENLIQLRDEQVGTG